MVRNENFDTLFLDTLHWAMEPSQGGSIGSIQIQRSESNPLKDKERTVWWSSENANGWSCNIRGFWFKVGWMCTYSIFWLICAASTGMYLPLNTRTYLIHKFIKFRGCLEVASERTNVPLSSAHTWIPFYHPRLHFLDICNIYVLKRIIFSQDLYFTNYLTVSS